MSKDRDFWKSYNERMKDTVVQLCSSPAGSIGTDIMSELEAAVGTPLTTAGEGIDPAASEEFRAAMNEVAALSKATQDQLDAIVEKLEAKLKAQQIEAIKAGIAANT